MAARTYRIETLGCKANRYDSRRLAEALETLGCRPAADDEPADLALVNTCTVTAAADRKGRRLAARLARQNPDGRVLVTGCYAEAAREELAAVEGVDGVYGRGQWNALLSDAVGGPLPPQVDLEAGEFGIAGFGGRARAFLKAQEGCDSFCAYCVLPFVRGRPRSRPLDGVRAEAARLARAGFAEIVLTGIHLGLYGRDLPGRPALAEALLAVAHTGGVERVRLSSIEVGEVDDALLDAMAHPAVCPHLHLPLQSGDAGVLRAMNRRYGPQEFLAAVRRVRARLDRPAITTDVMVGFPGETQEAFARTLALVEEARFSRLHVFPFSARPATAAAQMDGRVPCDVTAHRGRRLRELGARLAAEWAEGFVGRQVRVLFERRTRAARLAGYTDRYVPLTAPGGEPLIGRTARVRCTAARGPSLLGRITSY